MVIFPIHSRKLSTMKPYGVADVVGWEKTTEIRPIKLPLSIGIGCFSGKMKVGGRPGGLGFQRWKNGMHTELDIRTQGRSVALPLANNMP